MARIVPPSVPKGDIRGFEACLPACYPYSKSLFRVSGRFRRLFGGIAEIWNGILDGAGAVAIRWFMKKHPYREGDIDGGNLWGKREGPWGLKLSARVIGQPKDRTSE